MRRSAAFGLWQRWHEKSPKVCGLWASRWAHFRGATGGGVILQIQESLPHHQLRPCLLLHTFLDVHCRGRHKLGKHVLVYPWRARPTIGTTIGRLLQGVGNKKTRTHLLPVGTAYHALIRNQLLAVQAVVGFNLETQTLHEDWEVLSQLELLGAWLIPHPSAQTKGLTCSSG